MACRAWWSREGDAAEVEAALKGALLGGHHARFRTAVLKSFCEMRGDWGRSDSEENGERERSRVERARESSRARGNKRSGGPAWVVEVICVGELGGSSLLCPVGMSGGGRVLCAIVTFETPERGVCAL